MAINWYPVIDDELCVGCGNCVEMCPHGVYEMKGEKPAVINPDECVDGCKGCEPLCPAQAISHIGDKTRKSCSCGCGCDCK